MHRDDHPDSPKRLVSASSPRYAHQHWIPNNSISICNLPNITMFGNSITTV